MARLRRLYAPGVPQLLRVDLARPLAAAHEPTPAERLDLIQHWLVLEVRRQAVALHGWVLLPGGLALLATPATPQALPAVVQGLGRRMAARLVHGRVFQERYRATLVDEAWVPPCLTWLESLPVRQGLVDQPARWPWSSAQDHVGLRLDAGLLTDHPAYWEQGNTPFARQAHHQTALQTGVGESERLRIEQALQGQWALGNNEFLERVASRSSRRVAPAPRGRPRKKPPEEKVTK